MSDIYKTAMEKELLYNNIYYKDIFKKTEKIAQTVLFYLRNKKDNSQEDVFIKDAEEGARAVVDDALATLSCTSHTVPFRARTLLFRLIALDSRLRLLVASGTLPATHHAIFHNEIDAVVRALGVYIAPHHTPPADEHEHHVRQRVARAGVPPLPVAPDGRLPRRQRIVQILSEKKEVTIKDISEHIKDCSEKTIQRELNTMIKDNVVLRNGNRRWSLYTLATTARP